MRKKLMLEALAAWFALAAVSGQACASIQTGANRVLTTGANPEASLDEFTIPYSDGKLTASGRVRTNADVALLTSAAVARKGTRTRSTTGVHSLASSPFRVDAPQPNATLGSSPSGADDFAPDRRNGYGTELRRRVGFNRHDVVGAPRSQELLAAANGGSRDGDLDAEKFYLIADAKLAPGPTVSVPEPGNWATVLAGLLGVIAIARRRMSL
jgi:hypothetical protein